MESDGARYDFSEEIGCSDATLVASTVGRGTLPRSTSLARVRYNLSALWHNRSPSLTMNQKKPPDRSGGF
ncbi:Unannotated [Lentimonas sp. CC4]|nr:Unannotated [Lentimonas sp. CC4]CAA6686161.1 Unannotated [Lentimonas sp. CC6]CAA7074193.1 Unannotated [Lentimonas sp. CC4]CAA7171551.1 Unannotated [Lentimonas sp. CC21]CAA7182031.1 Unannotated [Lentimonas sp. CC8]